MRLCLILQDQIEPYLNQTIDKLTNLLTSVIKVVFKSTTTLFLYFKSFNKSFFVLLCLRIHQSRISITICSRHSEYWSEPRVWRIERISANSKAICSRFSTMLFNKTSLVKKRLVLLLFINVYNVIKNFLSRIHPIRISIDLIDAWIERSNDFGRLFRIVSVFVDASSLGTTWLYTSLE